MPDLNRRLFLSRLTGLAALPAAAWAEAPASASAPALLLAQDAPVGIDPGGYLVSEKYDGVRAVWNGRVLRFRAGLVHRAAAEAAAGRRVVAGPQGVRRAVGGGAPAGAARR